MLLYLLYESAAGLALFRKKKFDEKSETVEAIVIQSNDREVFLDGVKLKAFAAFLKSDIGLRNLNVLNEGKLTDELTKFLAESLKAVTKKGKKFQLAIQDKNLAMSINSQLGYNCLCTLQTHELFRGIRTHFTAFIKGSEFAKEKIIAAQLGLTHVYSRHRISEDVDKQDKHILQSTALIAQMEKNLNTFTMRIKEWYAWHFPELTKMVPDNQTYVQLVKFIQVRR